MTREDKNVETGKRQRKTKTKGHYDRKRLSTLSFLLGLGLILDQYGPWVRVNVSGVRVRVRVRVRVTEG